jgi:maltooligosyltrehalose synthase
LFAQGGYAACAARDDERESVCAFRRTHRERELLVVVRRFPAAAERDAPSRAVVDSGTAAGGAWTHVFTGESVANAPSLEAAALLGRLPAAVLVR